MTKTGTSVCKHSIPTDHLCLDCRKELMFHSTSPTDSQRLDEIRRRAEAATPGPWENIYPNVDEGDIRVQVYHLEKRTVVHYSDAIAWKIKDKDAEFIAHSREDIPWLLEQLAARDARDAEIAALKPKNMYHHRELIKDPEYRDELVSSLEEEWLNSEARAEKYRKALNYIVNDASSFGLEAEDYIVRAREVLKDG